VNKSEYKRFPLVPRPVAIQQQVDNSPQIKFLLPQNGITIWLFSLNFPLKVDFDWEVTTSDISVF